MWYGPQAMALFNPWCHGTSQYHTTRVINTPLFPELDTGQQWQVPQNGRLVDCLTVSLHSPNGRQFACHEGCARGLSVAFEKLRKFPPVTRTHSPLQLRQSQPIFRPTNHKRGMPANWRPYLNSLLTALLTDLFNSQQIWNAVWPWCLMKKTTRIYMCQTDFTLQGLDEMADILSWHFQMDFHEWKSLPLDRNFTVINFASICT